MGGEGEHWCTASKAALVVLEARHGCPHRVAVRSDGRVLSRGGCAGRGRGGAGHGGPQGRETSNVGRGVWWQLRVVDVVQEIGGVRRWLHDARKNKGFFRMKEWVAKKLKDEILKVCKCPYTNNQTRFYKESSL